MIVVNIDLKWNLKMIICSCLGIKEAEFRKSLQETKSLKKSLEKFGVTELLCGYCQEDLLKMLKEIKGE